MLRKAPWVMKKMGSVMGHLQLIIMVKTLMNQILNPLQKPGITAHIIFHPQRNKI
jgi:hypothetical protein